MKIKIFTMLLFFALVPVAFADNGVVSLKSHHDVKTTADRLEDSLKKKGMTVFARINHSEGARNVGIEFRPTTMIIFGNPKVGTPFMRCGQRVAIDLPQKALIWKDETGIVRLSYNDPDYLAKRHGITGCEEVIKKIKGALANFAKDATKQ